MILHSPLERECLSREDGKAAIEVVKFGESRECRELKGCIVYLVTSGVDCPADMSCKNEPRSQRTSRRASCGSSCDCLMVLVVLMALTVPLDSCDGSDASCVPRGSCGPCGPCDCLYLLVITSGFLLV